MLVLKISELLYVPFYGTVLLLLQFRLVPFSYVEKNELLVSFYSFNPANDIFSLIFGER